MPRIVIAGCGTLGDHLPLVALGRALSARGHEIWLAFNRSMRGLAEGTGLELVTVDRSLDAETARSHASQWDHWSAAPGSWREELLPGFVQTCEELAAACARADLLVCPVNQLAGPVVHEKVGVPWITATLMPFAYGSGGEGIESSSVFARAPAPPKPGELTFPEFLSRARRLLGMTSPLPEVSTYVRARQELLAASPHFYSVSPQQYPEVITTGFWPGEDLPWANPPVSEDLQEFVGHQPSPLVLSFSSLPVTDAARVVAVHARAAAMLGRRLVILSGWSDFSWKHLPDDVPSELFAFAGFVPHEWLFARAAAVILHGGIGSIAQAIRAGVPILVEPYGNDQFFNAWRIVRLGIGAAMHPHRLTPDNLVRVLREKVLDHAVRARVGELGAKVRRERGLEAACEAIDAFLAGNPRDKVD